MLDLIQQLINDDWSSYASAIAFLVVLAVVYVVRNNTGTHNQQQLSPEAQAEMRRLRLERLKQRPSLKSAVTTESKKNVLEKDCTSKTSSSGSSATSKKGSNLTRPSSSIDVVVENAPASPGSYNEQKRKPKNPPRSAPPAETLAATTTEEQPKKKKNLSALSQKPPVEIIVVVLKNLVSSPDKTRTVDEFLYQIESAIPKEATWEELQENLWPSLVATNLRYDSLRQALGWLRRIRDVIQYSSVTSEIKEHLRVCLDVVLRTEITQRVGRLILNQHEKEASLETSAIIDDDDFEMSELFSDNYGGNATTHETSQPIVSSKSLDPLTEFLQLLEPVETILTARVLQDLQAQYPNVPKILLHKTLGYIPSIDPCHESLDSDRILRSLTCLSNLVVFSGAAAKELLGLMEKEVNALTQNADKVEGRKMEMASVLRKLVPIAALSVPNLGQETFQAQTSRRRALSYFQRTIRKNIDKYPVAVFARNQSNVKVVLDEPRRVMQQARNKCTIILKRAIKSTEPTSKKERQCFFRWLSLVVQTNESNAHVLTADLLRADGPQQICASRKFLLGTAAVTIEFCVDALWQRYHKLGPAAFDPLFLVDSTSGLIIEGERPLLLDSGRYNEFNDQAGVFTGTTEFFFLSAALLRVSLFPGLRAQQELGRHHGPIFDGLRKLADKLQDSQIPTTLLDERSKTSVDALLGWETVLQDPDFLRTITKLSILQLDWLGSIAGTNLATTGDRSSDLIFSIIPEWFCKLPAEWIAFVASRAPTTLTVADGEAAVEVATRLLHLGTEFQGQNFSPPVITELIRIPGAFVRSGVARARASMAAKNAKSIRGRSMEEQKAAVQDFIVDERKCDFDIAFDRNGLGTTAFTNEYVQSRLSSTLLSTFSALDAVEGVNVEREHAFDKFHVKGEVAELLLRLWSHPSGGARRAVLDYPAEELSAFVTSLVSAIGLQMDDSCLKLLDVREILKKNRGRPLSGRDAQHYDYLAKNVSGGFAAARKLLRLLMHVTEFDKVAALLGGSVEIGKEKELPVTRAVTNLFLTLIERITGEDGRTNPELDFRMVLRPEIRASDFIWLEFGLDVSVLAHYMLAFAARLHVAVIKTCTSKNTNISRFVELVAENEDCTARQLRAVLNNINGDQLSSRGINSRNIDRNRQWCIAQDQFTHISLDPMASREDIMQFIDCVQDSKERLMVNQNFVADIDSFETMITCCCEKISEETYTEWLEEWTFSSEPFVSASGRFDHFYDVLARKRANVASAKVLQKEAKKTKRLLPSPLASAAIYICFAEERMDVCRAIITGPESTPYSLGLFVFDLFFPATYPSVPPLITFLTTGGGQVRFSPNLYNDGKVCISLLGTAHAWNASQQWNSDSSLAQVLMSIQTQILGVNDPYFSEGFGHSNTKGTRAGDEASNRYNNNLRLATLRHAIIDHLKSPPRGFEEVALRHFSLCRKRLLVQARCWLAEARGTPIQKRFERAYNTLVTLLSSDRITKFEGCEGDVLAPLHDDVKRLSAVDAEFARTHNLSTRAASASADEEDKKPPAAAVDSEMARAIAEILVSRGPLITGNNPWANGGGYAYVESPPEANKRKQQKEEEEDDDDEIYR